MLWNPSPNQQFSRYLGETHGYGNVGPVFITDARRWADPWPWLKVGIDPLTFQARLDHRGKPIVRVKAGSAPA